MNSIYEETLRAVENGAGFKVDFRRRNLKIDGRYVIENGRYEGELGVPPSSEDEFFSNVEELYCRYKHSVPSERSEGKSRRYFRAMPEKDLDDDDMLYGERRDKAQVALELYLLSDTPRLQMESRDDGTLVLAKQDRQRFGNTP